MPESNQDANPETPDESSAAFAASESSARREKPTLGLAAITIGVAALLTGIAQYFAPQFDHQNANLIGLTCMSMALLYALFCLHRLDRWGGHHGRARWWAGAECPRAADSPSL